MGTALAITIPIMVFFLGVLVLWFLYLNQRMAHERAMLALQKGLIPEPIASRLRCARRGRRR